MNLVRSGSWTSAANVYAACDSATKAQCNAAARQAIRGQVTSAVAAGECSRARSIVAAGTRMGVSVPQLQKAAANCK